MQIYKIIFTLGKPSVCEEHQEETEFFKFHPTSRQDKNKSDMKKATGKSDGFYCNWMCIRISQRVRVS